MAYIWHLNIDGQIELHEDAIKLLPVLSYFENRYIKYIILYADYRLSPIKDFPDHQREKIAKLKSGFLDSDDLNTEEMRIAIEEYTGLIYDERRDMKRILQRQLEEQKMNLRNGVKDLKQMKEIMDISTYLELQINRIETKLTAEGYDDDPDIKGDKKLSYVEKWIRRRKRYLSQLPSDAH